MKKKRPELRTAADVREFMQQKYGSYDRKLVILKDVHDPTAIFMYLEGTPPKYYGLFIPELKRLQFYDLAGKPRGQPFTVDKIEGVNDDR